jgi:hypothetical protein
LTALQIAARLDRSLYAEEDLVGTGPRTTRSGVKKQIQRIRESLQFLLLEIGLRVKAEQVVQTVYTSTREVRYRVNAHLLIKAVGNNSE